MTASGRPEVAWFSALCGDDYEYLGVPDPTLRFGYRTHVVVRDTEVAARAAAAARLVSRLDAAEGGAIRNRSLDTTASPIMPPRSVEKPLSVVNLCII